MNTQVELRIAELELTALFTRDNHKSDPDPLFHITFITMPSAFV